MAKSECHLPLLIPEKWDEAFEYFQIAWAKVVLPRLKYRFEVGPIDWTNPPKLN